MRRRVALAVAAAFSVWDAGSAHAQAVFDARCAASLAGARLAFDHQAHGRWYRRFWTGDCDQLLFCQRGSPNWREVVDRAAREGSSGSVARACRLGMRLGHEWARDNHVRRIDTDDLRVFNRQMLGGGDFDAALRQVSAEVDRRLGAR